MMNAQITRLNYGQNLQGDHSLLEALLESSKSIAAEVELERVVQKVTDVATSLCGAAFGAFFYNVEDENGKISRYAVSSSGKQLFSGLPNPGKSPVSIQAFKGRKTIRYFDVTRDKDYGRDAPHFGIPEGHPKVRSYMAVPVISRNREDIIGSLLFGHPRPGVFTESSQRLAEGIAAQGAIAMENAMLFEERKRTTAHLAAKTRQLQYANEELLNFTYTLSHDLKNPLSVISAYSSMADEFDTVEELRAALKHVCRNSHKIQDILEGLLKIIKAEERSAKAEWIDLNELIESIEEELIDEINKTGFRIHTRFEMDEIQATRGYLESILRNIISNSIKYRSESDDPKITIATKKDGNKAVFTCSDNGIGIDMQEHAKELFQPFKRFADHTPGTGIGLFMVKRLVEKQGGSIKIDSKLGAGTTCTFDLPVC